MGEEGVRFYMLMELNKNYKHYEYDRRRGDSASAAVLQLQIVALSRLFGLSLSIVSLISVICSLVQENK